MLSEEEKKAVERLNEILKEWQEIVNIADKTEREIEMSLYMEDMPFEEIKTALNIITKLQQEKRKLKAVKEMYVKHKHIYQKEWLDELESNREKDKIINLMQEYFVGLTVWDKEKDEPIILGDKKEVEEFFEKLAKEKVDKQSIKR